MSITKSSKKERREKLKMYLEKNIFSNDEELAEYFKVSIATIRLDRMVLGIPEVRERTKNVAQEAFEQVPAITPGEMLGELVSLEMGKSGVSELVVTPQLTLGKTKILSGHYLFTQANSLALAMIDADVVLTGTARLRYKRPVSENEKVIARALVKAKRSSTYLVSVYSYVGEEIVFKAQIVLLVK